MNPLLEVRDEVREALDKGRPVVALESTVISHGMPYPRNIEAALRAEAIAREMGVVPATIAVFDGRIRVGLVESEIERLAVGGGVLKVSRMDLSYALATKSMGATTVSGTMVAARMAGISAFATGGIGGVHRGAGDTMDISADLLELARTPVLVVSAGAKAILDLDKTLEFLETQGVPVVGFRTDEFPAFYSRSSGLPVPLSAQSPEQVAAHFAIHRQMGLTQGILVANPVPPEDEIPREQIGRYLDTALAEMAQRGIRGKEVTPFLLSRLVELSQGRCLEANRKLLENNVRLACSIAKCLSSQG